MIEDEVDKAIDKVSLDYYKRLEAAVYARKKLSIKRTDNPKTNHLRIIEFMTLQNHELEVRGLKPDLNNLALCRQAYKERFNEEAPGL